MRSRRKGPAACHSSSSMAPSCRRACIRRALSWRGSSASTGARPNSRRRADPSGLPERRHNHAFPHDRIRRRRAHHRHLPRGPRRARPGARAGHGQRHEHRGVGPAEGALPGDRHDRRQRRGRKPGARVPRAPPAGREGRAARARASPASGRGRRLARARADARPPLRDARRLHAPRARPAQCAFDRARGLQPGRLRGRAARGRARRDRDAARRARGAPRGAGGDARGLRDPRRDGPDLLLVPVAGAARDRSGPSASRGDADRALRAMLDGSVRTFFDPGLGAAQVLDLVPVKPLAEAEPQILQAYRDALPPPPRQAQGSRAGLTSAAARS